jgi:DNA-binding PucR family transcriptional regulator
LFVHPNTVRYRLKKVSEVLDWDPGAPRDALTLHLAIILGAMSEPNTPSPAPGKSL